MTKFWLVASLMCCAATSLFGAAPLFTINGSTTWEQNRIVRLEKSLNFTKVAMVPTWEVTIWPEDQFERYVHENNLDTDIAFTFLGQNHTYVNEYYLIWAHDDSVRYVLGHEAGHMICNCKSESKADEIAYQLTR